MKKNVGLTVCVINDCRMLYVHVVSHPLSSDEKLASQSIWGGGIKLVNKKCLYCIFDEA